MFFFGVEFFYSSNELMEKNLYSIGMQYIVKESSQWNEETEKKPSNTASRITSSNLRVCTSTYG